MAPLCDALPRNSHLCTLEIISDASLSADFVRDHLLPAVRANTGLRKLQVRAFQGDDRALRALQEAERIVAARS